MADPAPGKIEADRAGWFVRDYFPDGVCPASNILLDGDGTGTGIDFNASAFTTGILIDGVCGTGISITAGSLTDGIKISATTPVDGIEISSACSGSAFNVTGTNTGRALRIGTKVSEATSLKISSGETVDAEPANNYLLGLFTKVNATEATSTDELRSAWIRTRVNADMHVGQSANWGYGVCGAEVQLKFYGGSGGTDTYAWQNSALWAQLETAGATTNFKDGSVSSCVLANVGLTATTVIDNGAVVAGVAINSNTAGSNVTATGGFYGLYIYQDNSACLDFKTGIHMDDNVATTGIELGACTTGITLTGAMATGMSITGATTNAMLTEIDTTSANNAKIGLNISKDVTNATAAAALSSTNQAINITSVNASSASASGVLTVSSGLIAASQANSTAVAQADIYNATLLALTYSATTTSAGTATSSAKGIAIDYNLIETSGTLSVDDFSIFDIDFDTTGTVSYLAGTYNAINVSMVDAGVPTHASSTIFNGLQIDASGLDVSDGDMTLSGIKVTVPAATNAIYVAGGNIAMGTSGTRLSSTTEEDRFLSCYYTAAGKNIYGWYLNISQTYATDGAPRGLTIRTSLDHTSGFGPQGANSVDARVTLGVTNTGISGEMHAMESQLKIDADTRSLNGTYSAHKFTNYIKDGNTMPATTFFLRFVDQNGSSVATPLMFDFSGLTAGASNCIVANANALAAAEYFLRVKSPDGGTGYIPILSALN